MTRDHLAKAREYIDKGDDFYLKAAKEIRAWLDANASRTQKQAADGVGKSDWWVREVLRNLAEAESGHGTVTNGSHKMDWRRGSHATKDELENPERIAKALEKPEVAEAVAKAATPKAAKTIVQATETETLRRAVEEPTKESRRTREQIDAAQSEHLPDPPPPDPWKEFRAGVRAGGEACDSFDLTFEYMHPEAWNLPPQSTEGIERDAAKMAERFRTTAVILEALAATASQHIAR